MTSKITEELKAIAKKHGGLLKPEVVVDEARNPKSILHNSFDWEDSIAAEKWRLEQARALIRISVEYEPSMGKEIRVFFSLTTDRGETGYRETINILANKGQKAQLLEDAKNEMQVFINKYAMLKELASVFKAMNKFLKK